MSNLDIGSYETLESIRALFEKQNDMNIAPDPLVNSAKNMPGKRAIQERDKILDVQDRLKDACYLSAKRLSEEIDRYLAEDVIVTPEDKVVSKRHYFSGFYVSSLKDCACHFAKWGAKHTKIMDEKQFAQLVKDEMRMEPEMECSGDGNQVRIALDFTNKLNRAFELGMVKKELEMKASGVDGVIDNDGACTWIRIDRVLPFDGASEVRVIVFEK